MDSSDDTQMTMKLWLAGITGLVIGILAAAAQAFANVEPPEAYAVCMVCHPATIVQWIMNNYLGTEVPLPSAFVLFPSLLAVGIVIGSMSAANRHGELGWRRHPGKKKYMAVLFGFIIANLGLLVAGCPLRIGLLVSYGSVTYTILLAALVGGIGLACVYLRLRKE